MTMSSEERRKIKGLIDGGFIESDSPTIGNMALFYDEHDIMVYAGIIENWPTIIATDVEWGQVERKDATKQPFAGKKVRFFSPFKGD